MNGLEAPGSSRGTAADAGHLGHSAPRSAPIAPTTTILTTGDAAEVDALVARLFDGAPFRAQRIEVGRRSR